MPIPPTAPQSTLTLQDLRSLVCPVCHAGLQLEAQSIACSGCSRHYPVVDGIPVLLVDRAI
jgi:uncharacterized protein YbaR (Trm112 family)